MKTAAHRLWYWLGQSKDQWAVLQSIATIFALLVGAAWVLINFDILSEWIAEVSLEQTVKAYKVLDDAIILQVDVNLRNSSKRSVTYYCKETYIMEFLPLTEEDAKTLRASVKKDINFYYTPPQMKALHEGIRLVVPANGSAVARSFWSVSPYAREYTSIDDNSAKIKSVIVRSRFYADPQCMLKLDRNEGLSYEEVTSVFDMEANTTAPSTR